MPDTPVPQNIGPYQILAPLGHGGMGQVYRARDSRLNREVALKLLPPEYSADPVRKQRFEQEARAVAALNHPGILSIYDVGDGWMVTELVDGETLRGAQLTISQIIDIGAQIAEALAAAHETGITHRDLKPDNILLTADGRTKILDFGLAQVADSPEAVVKPEDKKTITTPGIPLGTPGYMSPEQVRGQTVDQRSDIFSLGVVLYELLSGKPAFEKPSALEVMHAILTEDPEELPASVPDGIRRIVKRCLEKKPAQRFQSARDLAFALRSFGALMASGTALPRVADSENRRQSWLWPVVAILGSIAVLALVFTRPKASPAANIANYKFQPFAFSQGEEYSGVWSPDGQSIAFLQQTPHGTHLLVQSLDAPAPTLLADQAAQPAWSHDGSRIYFLKSNEILAVSRAGGEPQVVLPREAEKGLVSAFHISPDGNSLAIWQVVTRPKDGVRGSVWISSPPGAPPVEYTPNKFEVRGPFTPVYLQYSPDGKLLYLSMTSSGGAETWLLPMPQGSGDPKRVFADIPWNRPVVAAWMPDSQRLVLAGNAAPATGEQLFLANIHDNSLTRIIAWPEGGQTDPSVTLDSNGNPRLLFAHVERDRDIVQLPLDGGEPKTLLATSLSEFSPSWSPVNEEFAYVTRRNGTDELWVRSAEANWDRPVVTAKEFPTLEVLLSPKFSPDGSRIAYTALLAGSGLRRRSLAISSAGGGVPTVVADGYAPTWKPDGSTIAFLWAKPDGTIPVAVLKLGSDQPPQEIIVGSGVGVPEWAPSGEWIASSTPGGVILVSEDGKARRVLPSLGNPAVLAWSKDSKTLYGLSYNAEPPILQAMDVRTQAIRKIAEYPNLSFTPLLENLYTGTVRLSRSPDGKNVAVSTASSKSDLWILDGFTK